METNTRVGGDGGVRLEDEWRWPVVLYRGARDNEPKPRTWDALEMCRALGVHKSWTRPKITAPAWSPVTMKPGAKRRAKSNVESISMLVFDCDAGDPLEVLEALGDDYIRIGHTSWSHSAETPKARLVFPFRPAWPCPAAEWSAVWGAGARWAAQHGVTIDPAVKDPSRLYFGPYHARTREAEQNAAAWVYGPRGSRGGRCADRARGYLEWSWLVSTFPEPEPELEEWVVVKSDAGDRFDSNDRHEKRRRAFAAGMVRHRAEKLATTGQGSRNAQLFGAARLVGQLEQSNAIHAEEALAELGAAGATAGLSRGEIHRTLRSGYAAGRADGAYAIEQEMGQ